MDHALALRQPAANARENGNIGGGDDRLRYHRLRRERIDRHDRVRIDISDDREVGRKHDGAIELAKDRDSAALRNDRRNPERKLAQCSINRGRRVCHKRLHMIFEI